MFVLVEKKISFKKFREGTSNCEGTSGNRWVYGKRLSLSLKGIGVGGKLGQGSRTVLKFGGSPL